LKIRFIGDVHGKKKAYFKLIKGCEQSIQVGDMGIGFTKFPKEWDKNHQFIRGNHDNPSLCKKHPNYIGDSSLRICSTGTKIFFLSGGFSIDWEWRQSYNLASNSNKLIWWRAEELAEYQLVEAINEAKKFKPDIIVSHTCPNSIKDMIIGGNAEDKKKFKSRTEYALQELFEDYQPKLWVFGHFHTNQLIEKNGTNFVCLKELGVMDLETLEDGSFKIEGDIE